MAAVVNWLTMLLATVTAGTPSSSESAVIVLTLSATAADDFSCMHCHTQESIKNDLALDFTNATN